MPLYLLRVYADRLPRLRASDALSTAEAMAVGSGAMDSSARRDLLRDWQQLAAPDSLKAIKASPAMLADAGIGIAP